MTALHKRKLFSVDNPKASKAAKYGYLNAIHYMAPADVAGVGNLCPHATPGCKASCLGMYSGKGYMSSVRKSREDKAREFMTNRKAYLAAINLQIEQLKLEATYHGLKLCVRLNGSTDIDWRGVYLAHPGVQFVEYTKNVGRMFAWLRARARGQLENLHLTFSRSETNDAECDAVMRAGGNVAVVYRKVLPTCHQFVEFEPNGTFDAPGFTYKVIDGDAHDLRHLDERGAVVGLTAKGGAKTDASGFVVNGNTPGKF